MATIREIARLTNVSPTTVSNVIHGRTGKVSVENVRRIQQALQDHHYFPKYGLEVMQKGKTRIVGIVAYIRHYYKSLIDDAFYGSIIGALEKEIRQMGYYTMLLIENDRDAIYQAVKSWNMSGLITITFPWQDYRKLLVVCDVPVIGIDTYGARAETDYVVSIDDEDGGYQGTSFLLDTGFDRILMVTETKNGTDMLRYKGYLRAFCEHGRTPDPNDRILMDVNPHKRHGQLKGLLQFARRNCAIFCLSDKLAVEIMNFFLSNGFQIPRDISVCGFDDNVYASIVTPQLTTIRQDVDLKAKMAVELLRTVLKGEEPLERSIVLPTSLVKRGSVRE